MALSAKSLFRRGARLIVLTLAAWGLLLAIVTLTPALRWWAALLQGPWNDPRGDTLILLGGDYNAEGMIGLTSYWRSVYGVWAWREGGFQQVVISGDAPISEPMRQFLICQGVPASAILVENRSTSTRENALFTAELLRNRPGRKVLLTSDYHMFRARRAFEKAGLAVLPRPFPDANKRFNSWTNRWDLLLNLAGETAKIAYYRARGWI